MALATRQSKNHRGTRAPQEHSTSNIEHSTNTSEQNHGVPDPWASRSRETFDVHVRCSHVWSYVDEARSIACGPAEFGQPFGNVVRRQPHSRDHDAGLPFDIVDVRERVAVQEHEVGALPYFHCAERTLFA